jgi:transcriptional regulator with XRE-family HTH domain
MDRDQLADFVRRRREALQPEDVGLARSPRRRTAGLRREEVALLASMSTDYLTRIEQGRGPQPSEPMLAAMARALRLSQAERDHLFRLAGHTAPARTWRSSHVSPALMRVLDRLDTPAQVMSDLGETFVQNDFAVALLGDHTQLTGNARFTVFRWFTDPASRAIYPMEDHPVRARQFVAGLRAAVARDPEEPTAKALLAALLETGEEFRALWAAHEVPTGESIHKRLVHPRVGTIEIDCQTLVAETEGQLLLVYTATPGTEDSEKLRLLAVIGTQEFGTSPRGEAATA